MIPQHGIPIAQGAEMRDRTLSKTSATTGHLEDQSLDLDARTMAILGKKQRLNRNFGFVSLVAFSTTLLVSWEAIAATFQSGLVSGGPSVLLYGLFLSWLGAFATAASLAELSSMSPTAGGQYHWVAELAPMRFATTFSWAAGWVTSFARISDMASTAYVAGTMVQSLLIFNRESYTPKNWHGTLLYWAVLLIACSVNILGVRYFPHVETVAFIIHITFFFVFLIPLVYLSPQSTSKFVFTDFENSSGWSSNGISWIIGIMPSAWSFVGIDGTTHMSEEVKNAAVAVPRSMIIAHLISGVFAIALSIALLFSVGDILSVLQSPTQYPIIQVIYVATGSKPATTALIAALASTLLFSTFGLLASASRLTWAFARDKGFPFPDFFAHVSKAYMIPVRAILLILAIGLVLGLINIGSSTAFNAMASLALVGHYASYLLPITLLVLRRFGKKHIPWGPFTLGRWGLPINLFAMIYSTILMVFMVFPPYQPVTAENMNYSSLVFGGVLIFGTVVWLAYGRKVYMGPVKEVIDAMHLKRDTDKDGRIRLFD